LPMNRIALGVSAGAIVVVGLSGCGGQLFIDEASLNPKTPCTTWQDCKVGEVCIDLLCKEAEPCAIGNPDGVYCPEGRTCTNGVCIKNDGGGGDEWCPTCPDNQGCNNGDCVPITVDNECGPTHPDGVCSDGEVCVAGNDDTYCVPIISHCGCEDETQTCENEQCVDIAPGDECSTSNPDGKCRDGHICVAGVCEPWTNACSVDSPLGLCAAGSACVGGYCIPIDENLCGIDNPNGLCSPGRVCTPPCVAAPCSSAFPSGYCQEDEICVAGECEQLPCLPRHPGGACPSGWYCSLTGGCIEDGSCAHPDDCQNTGGLCSCLGQCINSDSCMADCDCPDFYLCNTNAGRCERTYDCLDDDGCPANTEFCAESDECLPQGSCIENGDCRANNVFCSEVGPCTDLQSNPDTCRCMNVGKCRNDEDCLEFDPEGNSFCNGDGDCLAEGTCTKDDDCPPGNKCNLSDECVLGPNLCDANDFVRTCTDNNVLCCDSGTCCAIEGEVCSALDTCIQVGECLDDADCLGGAAGGLFTCVDYVCTPVTAGCTACTPATADEKCSVATNSCIPKANCVGNKDCAEGEICHATFTCVPALNCGTGDPGGAFVKPNVMVVLDRSGSMEYCDLTDAPGTSRWTSALNAIDTLTSNFNGTVSFGLSSYPKQWCGTDSPCSVACNVSSCFPLYCVDASGNCEPNFGTPGAVCTSNGVPGAVDLAATEFAYDDVNTILSGVFPGGGTPTGATLRMLHDNAVAAGLQTPGRDNVAVLITDGEANSDFAAVAGCVGPAGVCINSETCPPKLGEPILCRDHDETTCEAASCKWNSVASRCESLLTCNTPSGGGDGSCHDIPCKVNHALDKLRDLTPPVDTFVIGFAFGAVSPNLNCYAIHGGRSLCNTDDAVCVLFETGGRNACEAASCAWVDSACVGNDDFCVALTADGEMDCEAELSCNWNNAGDGLCEPDATFCTAVAVGGTGSCSTAGCNWDSSAGGACRGGCSAFDGNQSACEAALCHYDGSACVSVGAGNCADANATCYYDAGDATSLSEALDAIVGDVATCSFDLSSNPPPELDKLYVYLEYLDPSSIPEDCSNPTYDLCRHPRDRSRIQHWDYDPIKQQVEFFGDACADLTTGVATPLVIYGCCVGEGC